MPWSKGDRWSIRIHAIPRARSGRHTASPCAPAPALVPRAPVNMLLEAAP
jgi:hypothetical protein